jgi:PAS domain S-box-containing protein
METHADFIRHLETIARRATDAFLIVTPDRAIESSNPAASLLFGVESSTLRGTALSRWLPDFTGALDRPLAAWDTEATTQASDRIPVEVSIVPLDDGEGRAWILLRDVTRRRGLEGSVRKHAEELERMVTNRVRALDELHRRYRSLYDLAPILDFEIDSQGAISSANRKAFLSIGVAIEKLVGVPIIDLVIAPGRDAFRDAIAQARRGCALPIETKLRGGDGSALDIIFHAVQEDVQRPGSLRLLGLDVTSHREAERLVDQGLELAEAQRARMERILRGIAQGIAVMDADGQIRLMNGIGEKLLGMEERWAFGRDLFKEHEDFRFTEAWSSYIDGEEEILSTEIRTGGPQGTRTWATISRIRTPEGRPAGFVALLRDTTQERRAEESMSNRMREIVEEMRAPLAAIRGFSPSLEREGLSREAQHLVTIVEKESGRLGDLLEDIQTLSRLDRGREGLNLRTISFSRMLEDTLSAASAAASARAIRFDVRGVEDDCSAVFDVETMRLVLGNLVQLALRLTFDGRAIEVLLGKEPRGLTCAFRTAGRPISKQELELVRDGLDSTSVALPSLAGPHRGLMLVRRVLQLHGGDVELENFEGGVSIRISIPSEEKTGTMMRTETAMRMPTTTTQTVPSELTPEGSGFADALIDDPDDEAEIPFAAFPPIAR